jgi:hypothetical protein
MFIRLMNFKGMVLFYLSFRSLLLLEVVIIIFSVPKAAI